MGKFLIFLLVLVSISCGKTTITPEEKSPFVLNSVDKYMIWSSSFSNNSLYIRYYDIQRNQSITLHVAGENLSLLDEPGWAVWDKSQNQWRKYFRKTDTKVILETAPIGTIVFSSCTGTTKTNYTVGNHNWPGPELSAVVYPSCF